MDSTEREEKSVDPVGGFVNEAVIVVKRKGTRENMKNAYNEQLKLLRPNNDDDFDTKTNKVVAAMILRDMEKELLHGPEPSEPSLELHRGSSQMAKDPAGDR